MGICPSVDGPGDDKKKLEAQEKSLNKQIQNNMDKDKDASDDILKLLLLGTGDSGKSTLFKQIIQLYGKGFSDEARAPYANICYTNTIFAMKTLIIQSAKLDPSHGTRISPESEPSAKFLLEEVKVEQAIDKDIAKHIKILWADPGIRATYNNRSRFQLDDACFYFFGRVDAMAEEDFLPTYQDVLRCRARTTGIVETEFVIEEYHFKMLDVGGQRNERKKWIHCFENVTAVIFVAAMNEYDQLLFEDNVTNRIVEALNLFSEICNSRWFRNKSMILFLNKDDLFREKIKTVDLKVCFEEYDGGCDYDKASAYMKRQFLKRNEYPDTKRVYVHITCATDTANISFTFNVVSDIIVKERLKECGLMV
jgi:GTPase SAR1 family protein